MNKALAISLFVICNVAAVFALSAVSLFIVSLSVNITHLLFTLMFTSLIGLAAVIALGYASSRLLHNIERKYSFKAQWFVLASYISPIIGAAVYWIVYLSLDATGHFPEYLDGVKELLYAILLSVTAVTYLISGGIWSSSAKTNPSSK